MKKIGIFINKELKKNAGGPSGYLYNLKIGLDKFDNNIEFFTINNTAEKNTEGIHKTIKYNPIYLDFRLAISYLFKGIKTKKRMNSDLYKMSCVHVHAIVVWGSIFMAYVYNLLCSKIKNVIEGER